MATITHYGESHKTEPLKESYIERTLTSSIRARGGECWKFVSPSLGGVPDRIILLDGCVLFVELKTDTGRLRPDQRIAHKLMNAVGIDVYVLHGVQGVVEFLEKEIDK